MDLVDRKRVIQRKHNFGTILESLISPTILKLEQMLWIHLAFFFENLHLLLKVYAYISHNIPESQNEIHNICRESNSERNKNPLFLLQNHRAYSDSIRKKEVFSRANYQRKYKKACVSLCKCRASLTDFYVSV